MKCNPLKCPGCISVTGLRTREGRQGEPAPWQGNIPPLPNLGFKSTLINPLIQHFFDSQLMQMRSRWSGQDRRWLSTVRRPGVRGWRASGPQHHSSISFSIVILATNKPRCSNNSLHNGSTHIYSLNPCMRGWKVVWIFPWGREREKQCSDKTAALPRSFMLNLTI